MPGARHPCLNGYLRIQSPGGEYIDWEPKPRRFNNVALYKRQNPRGTLAPRPQFYRAPISKFQTLLFPVLLVLVILDRLNLNV